MATDTPVTRTIRIVHIHCDMTSISGDTAAKIEEDTLVYLIVE